VVISECNAAFACENSGAVPCVKVGGRWYVDWAAWLATAGQTP
jgi:hypothetical protein